MDISVLRPYCYGQVTALNEKQNRTINVKILEYLPRQYGIPDEEVSTTTIDVETFLKDESDVSAGRIPKTINCSFKDFLPAQWLNRSSERITPPRVITGQRVLIWRVGDSRQYYWEELDVDMRLKPEEHIVIAINNHNEGKDLTLDTAYIIELSTVDQRMRVITNRNNGEKAAYEVDINGANGYLKMMDDCQKDEDGNYAGNGLHINSVDTIVTLRNINDSHYILNGDDIFVNCKGNRTTTIGGHDKLDAGSMETNTTTHDTTATAVTMDADTVDTTASAVTTEANTITEKGSTIIMSAPSILAGGGAMMVTAGFAVGPTAAPAKAPLAKMRASLRSGNICSFNVPVVINNTLGVTAATSLATLSAGATTFSGAVSGASASWSVSCTAPNI